MRRYITCLMALTIGAVTLGFSSWAQADSVTVYTDRTDWENAISGSFSEEEFNDSTLNSDLSVTSDAGAISSNVWDDRLAGLDTTTWTFDNPVSAFGADWDLAPGGAGTGIKVTLGSFEVADEIPNSTSGFSFWGVVADFNFQSVLLEEGTATGAAETYEKDNMVYAGQTSQPRQPTAIPTPAAAPAGLALFGLLALRRRRDRASV